MLTFVNLVYSDSFKYYVFLSPVCLKKVSSLRMVHISGFILGPEELEIWAWTGLSSQKGHELKQEYNSNFDHALTFESQEVLLGQFPDYRTGISLHSKAKSKQVAISLSH